MTMFANPSGWAKRRQKARKRRPAKNGPERLEVRAIRAAFYAGAEPVAEPAKPDNAGPTTLATLSQRSDDGPLQQAYSEALSAERAKAFDLSGNWMQTRARVRDALGLARVPGSKAEAEALLMEAGYSVETADDV